MTKPTIQIEKRKAVLNNNVRYDLIVDNRWVASYDSEAAAQRNARFY